MVSDCDCDVNVNVCDCEDNLATSECDKKFADIQASPPPISQNFITPVKPHEASTGTLLGLSHQKRVDHALKATINRDVVLGDQKEPKTAKTHQNFDEMTRDIIIEKIEPDETFTTKGQLAKKNILPVVQERKNVNAGSASSSRLSDRKGKDTRS